MKNISKEDARSMAKQLRHPVGAKGLETGQFMHQTNIGMTMRTAEALEFDENDRVLEMGHGNCAHLAEIMQLAPIRYTGLDISRDMKKEAEKYNARYIEEKTASFHLYNGVNIPFEDNIFDKVMTVNTLYFWEKPVELLTEIYRVLKKGGTCAITYAHRDFVKSLPFAPYGFELYDNQKVRQLTDQTPFVVVDILNNTEVIIDHSDKEIERDFSILCIRK